MSSTSCSSNDGSDTRHELGLATLNNQTNESELSGITVGEKITGEDEELEGAASLVLMMIQFKEEKLENLVKACNNMDLRPWDIHDPESTCLSVVHSFELKDETQIHWRFQRVSLKLN